MSSNAGHLDGPLLTPPEAAALLRLPNSTVYDLVRRNVLPHIRIGRAVRFSRVDLEDYIESQRRSAA